MWKKRRRVTLGLGSYRNGFVVVGTDKSRNSKSLVDGFRNKKSFVRSYRYQINVFCGQLSGLQEFRGHWQLWIIREIVPVAGGSCGLPAQRYWQLVAVMDGHSVADPDPPDPYQFTGSGSVSKVGLDPDPHQMIRSGSNKPHWKQIIFV